MSKIEFFQSAPAPHEKQNDVSGETEWMRGEKNGGDNFDQLLHRQDGQKAPTVAKLKPRESASVKDLRAVSTANTEANSTGDDVAKNNTEVNSDAAATLVQTATEKDAPSADLVAAMFLQTPIQPPPILTNVAQVQPILSESTSANPVEEMLANSSAQTMPLVSGKTAGLKNASQKLGNAAAILARGVSSAATQKLKEQKAQIGSAELTEKTSASFEKNVSSLLDKPNEELAAANSAALLRAAKSSGTPVALQGAAMKSSVPNETVTAAASRAAHSLANATSTGAIKSEAKDSSQSDNESGQSPQNGEQTLFNNPLNKPDAVNFMPADKIQSARETQMQAVTVVHQIADAAERMRSDGRANVELQVRLNDGQEVSVKLQMTRGGELRAILKTDSEPLREALQQRWTEFASQSKDNGLRAATPVFESPGSAGGGVNDFSQQRDPQSRQQDFAQNENLPNHLRFALPRATTQSAAQTSIAAAPTPTIAAEAGLALYA